ncbi:hypothetical protein TNCV_2319541 [Trichonephila clavipes]|nr:hypothetical protein TNCV_2319541 [Trichonephila clavipes]
MNYCQTSREDDRVGVVNKVLAYGTEGTRIESPFIGDSGRTKESPPFRAAVVAPSTQPPPASASHRQSSGHSATASLQDTQPPPVFSHRQPPPLQPPPVFRHSATVFSHRQSSGQSSQPPPVFRTLSHRQSSDTQPPPVFRTLSHRQSSGHSATATSGPQSSTLSHRQSSGHSATASLRTLSHRQSSGHSATASLQACFDSRINMSAADNHHHVKEVYGSEAMSDSKAQKWAREFMVPQAQSWRETLQ